MESVYRCGLCGEFQTRENCIPETFRYPFINTIYFCADPCQLPSPLSATEPPSTNAGELEKDASIPPPNLRHTFLNHKWTILCPPIHKQLEEEIVRLNNIIW